ncbi:MAG: hypothetical protein JWO59_714 [Chloroflexi bacterium]|nr:hypothetical protein [Chloroflexota bacterium]
MSRVLIAPPLAPETKRVPHKRAARPEVPSDAAYHFWRQLAENVAHLREVQTAAQARLDARDTTPAQLELFKVAS